MVQEKWLELKMKFLFGYSMKFVISWEELTFGGGIKLWWGGESGFGEEGIFPDEGEWLNFWLVGGLSLR